MPPRPGPRRPSIARADLPDVFTPDTVRQLDFATIRVLSRRHNGVLSADEQRAFDTALREVMSTTAGRLDQSLRRFGRDRAEGFDPELRRSYLRTRERLAEQAEWARASFPDFADELDPPPAPLVDPALDPPPVESTTESDQMSLESFETAVEQTSDTLALLERIASIEQQQLEHHRAQALRDTRGVFFALLVSVAVIVAGVAPLVDAEPHQRWLILVWTIAVCVVAGLVYAVARARQSRSG